MSRVPRPFSLFCALTAALSGCVEPTSGEPVAPELIGSSTQELSWNNVVARVTGTGTEMVKIPNVGGHTHDLVEENHDYAIDEASPQLRHWQPSRMVATGGDCIHDDACLVFVGYGYPGSNCADCFGSENNALAHNDRLEVTLSQSDASDGLRTGQWRYLRFYLFIDPATARQTSGTGNVIAQVWQDHMLGPDNEFAKPPPFSINLVNNVDPDKFDLAFKYQKYSHTTDAGVPTEKHHYVSTALHTETVEKGVWYNFHVALKPQPHGSGSLGAIRIFRDRGLNFDFHGSVAPRNAEWQVNWGYPQMNTAPDGNTCPGGATVECVKPRYDVRVGMYRPSHATNGLPLQVLFMDSIKLTSAQAAMPGL